MKKCTPNKSLITSLIVIVFTASIVKAQAPQAVPYQAVVRNASGNAIANKTVAIRFSIRDASATGTIVYQEKQSAITNVLGLFSVNVGQGTVASGTFSGIDWAGNTKFLQIEVDTTGGNTFINMGTQQLLSVPYALNAKKADSATSAISSVNATYSANGNPVGTVLSWIGGATPPPGYFLCNGSAVSRTTYSALFALAGTTYGSGDGSTTFNLPDYRGLFLRGWDGGVGRDPDYASRRIGSYQADAFQGHWHDVFSSPSTTNGVKSSLYFDYGLPAGGNNLGISYTRYVNVANKAYAGDVVSNGASGTPRVSSETRPANVYVNYIIKY